MAILPEGAAEDLDLDTEANGTGPFQLDSVSADGITLDALRRLLGRRARASTASSSASSPSPPVPLTSAADRRGRLDRQRARRSRSRSSRAPTTSTVGQVPSVDYWYMSTQLRPAAVRRARGAPGDRHWPSTARRSPRPPSSGCAAVNQTAIPEESFWYYDYAPYERDIDAAQALLDEAGVDDLTMGLMVTDEYPETVEAAQVIAGQPRGRSASPSTSRPRSSAPGSTARARATSTPSCSAGSATSTRTATTTRSTPATGTNNYQGYCDPEIDELLTQAATEIDEDARKDLYDQAAERIVDANSYIYLYNPERRAGAGRRGVSGYEIRGRPGHQLRDGHGRRRDAPVTRYLVRRVRPGGGRAGRRQHPRLRDHPPGARRPGAPGARHPVRPGDLRRPAGAVRPRRAARRAVLHVARQRPHRRPRRELPHRASRSRAVILERLPATLSLAFGAILVALLIALPARADLGAAAPVEASTTWPRSSARSASRSPTSGWRSWPSCVFSLTLGWLPSGGYVPLSEDPVEWARHLILPAVIVGVVSGSILTRFVRSSVLEALGPGLHAHGARPRACPARLVVRRHVLRNALVPVVTVDRPPARLPAVGRRRRRGGLRVERARPARPAGRRGPRLPGAAGRGAAVRRVLPRDQPRRRPALRRDRPEDLAG